MSHTKKGLLIVFSGPSGSGKGTVSSILKKHGIPSIDTDAVYREMTSGDSPCMQALKESFGNDIVNADGGLDRAGLAAVVFGDAEKLKLLNRIAHSFILDETRRLLDEYRSAGYAAAIGVFSFLMIMVISVIVNAYFRKKEVDL